MTGSVVFLVMLGVGLSLATDPAQMTYMNQVEKDAPLKEEKPVQTPSAPKPCCAPKQWEGFIGGFTGFKPSWFSRFQIDGENVAISYDANNQRIAMNDTLYHGEKPINFRVIELFKEKKVYFIDNKGKCVSHELKGDFQPMCIPANATYNGHFVTGLGAESSQADSWMMFAEGRTVIVSVTPTQCVPTSEIVLAKDGKSPFDPMFAMVGFVNISAGIKQPSIFTPPKDCPPGEPEFESGIMQYMHQKFGGQ